MHLIAKRGLWECLREVLDYDSQTLSFALIHLLPTYPVSTTLHREKCDGLKHSNGITVGMVINSADIVNTLRWRRKRSRLKKFNPLYRTLCIHRHQKYGLSILPLLFAKQSSFGFHLFQHIAKSGVIHGWTNFLLCWYGLIGVVCSQTLGFDSEEVGVAKVAEFGC